MRTLIMGLGNPILSDDGVGIRVARELGRRIRDPHVTLREADVYGFGLLELMFGFDRVIVIDSVQTRGGNPGEFFRLTDEDLRFSAFLGSPHDTNFASALEMGRRLKLRVPREVVIYAVEAQNLTTFHEGCTPEVERSIPAVVEEILREEFHLGLKDPKASA